MKIKVGAIGQNLKDYIEKLDNLDREIRGASKRCGEESISSLPPILGTTLQGTIT